MMENIEGHRVALILISAYFKVEDETDAWLTSTGAPCAGAPGSGRQGRRKGLKDCIMLHVPLYPVNF
jgi:hypothetical protein